MFAGVDNFLRLLYELYGNASPELRLSSINQTIARFVVSFHNPLCFIEAQLKCIT